MVYNVPFYVDKAIGTEPLGCGLMAFVANALTVGSTTGAPALGTLPVESYANGDDIHMAQNGLALLRLRKQNAVSADGVLSNNYMHMGNMYTKYRVLNCKVRVSGITLFNSSATTVPAFAGATIWNSFATDDKEVIDTLGESDNFCRPFIRMNRNTRTNTFMNQYTQPSTFVHKFSPIKLIRDRTALTSGQFDGTCTRATTVGTTYPTYNLPSQEVYHALNFQLYAFGNSRKVEYSFPDYRLFAGYLTVVKTVKFFEPHANQDFYDAV